MSLDHPILRVVTDADAEASAAESAKTAPAKATPQTKPFFIIAPSPASVALSQEVANTASNVPLNAVYLAHVGATIADNAISFYHEAASFATGMFRNDVAPGLRPAEATRSWIGNHISALKKGSKSPNASITPYERVDDLKEAVTVASSDLDRATAVAKTAGLWLEERRSAVLRDALNTLVHREPPLSPEIVGENISSKLSSLSEMYLLGSDVLGASL